VLNVYVPLLIVATSIIFYASKRSLDMKEMETMSSKDAMMFPIIGSCVLFGLFLLFKFFAKEYLNLLFTFYFLLLGCMSVAMTCCLSCNASWVHPRRVTNQLSNSVFLPSPTSSRKRRM